MTNTPALVQDGRLYLVAVNRRGHALYSPIFDDVMDLAVDPGLKLVAYAAERGSTTEDGLDLLASWAASGRHPAFQQH